MSLHAKNKGMAQVPYFFFCPLHTMTSSVIYYSTDTRKMTSIC